jgi:hypothetical protein
LVAPSGAVVVKVLVVEVLGPAVPVVVLSGAVLAVPVSGVALEELSGRGVPIG